MIAARLADYASAATRALFPFVAVALPARAELDLTLLRSGDSYLKPTLQVDGGLFYESNAWFGKSREQAGDHVGFWSELGVMPGLEGQLSLDDLGTLRGRVSGVWTTTQFGLDAAGSNFDDRHPSQLTLEDAYLGWTSGDLFPSLGKDAIDLSVGSQKYQVGSGFLFWDGATDGGSERGGYWLSMRKAFELAAIARLRTGPFMGEVVYLKPNDAPDSSTDVVGTNFEWSFGERARLGAGYWYFADSESLLRDGLHVFDVRGDVHPFHRLPGLVLMGEVVYEKNGRLNESWGGYAEIGHSFDEVRAQPYASYRFASFTGNRGGLDPIEGFDPIFYGFSDWGSWYLGEVFGEFIGTNRNLDVHMLRLRAEPVPGWTVQLLGFLFRLDELATEIQPRLFAPRVVRIQDKHLGYEVDLIVDWEMNDHLTWSAVCGTLVPGKGLEQAAGGDSVWTHFMLYASVSF
jgi:hypothetical protein